MLGSRTHIKSGRDGELIFDPSDQTMSNDPESWTKISSGAELEDLDNQRDEMNFETFDEFFKDRGGIDATPDFENIRSLEVSLENEKNRLAQMEVELLEAKKQRESGQQIIVMKKQSKALMAVMEKLSNVNNKETFNKQEWDLEWQERMSTFHKQHREMEEALKNRHINELKHLQEEMQRNIRRLAVEVQKTKGIRVPSPRTLSHLQEENMSRIIVLFQKHAQERLLLAGKVAKQEELLIRSKNQSLQKLMGEAQAVAGQWYRKFNLPVPEFKRLQITLPPATSEAKLNRTEFNSHKLDARGDQNGPASRSSNVYTGASRASTAIRISLSSPRMGEEGGTFLTEIDYAQPTASEEAYLESGQPSSFEPAGASSSFGVDTRHSGFSHSAAPTGSLAASQPAQGALRHEESGSIIHKPIRYNPFGPERVSSEAVVSREGTQGNQSTGGRFFQKTVQYGDQSAEVLPYKTNPEGYRTSVDLAGHTNNAILDQMSPVAFHMTKDEVKPPWNSWKSSFVSQAIAPVYGPPSHKYPAMSMHGTTGFKKPGLSPYLIPQPSANKVVNKHGSSSARVVPRDTVGATRSSQADVERSRSVSARLMPKHDVMHRAASTLPVIHGASRDDDELHTHASAKDVRTVFPHLDEQGSQRISNESHGKGETSLSSSKTANFAKLESWIEDKIKMILSGPNAGPIEKKLANPDLNSSFKAPETELGLTNESDIKAERDKPDINQRGTVRAGQEEVPDLKSNGEINSLLSRLRTTMGSDAPRDPQPQAKGLLRNGMEKSRTDVQNEGLGFFNPKNRVSESTTREQRFRGQEISQEPFDESKNMTPFNPALHEDEIDIEREQDRRQKEDDRRDRLKQLDVDPILPVTRQKSAKKVEWNLESKPTQFMSIEGEEDTGVDAFRPETGVLPSSRPDTSASSLSGNFSRPDSTADSRRPETSETLDLEKEFFSLVRHNKVKEFEEVLLRANVPIDTRDQFGNTALMIASQNGHKRIVKICLHHEANPNTTNHMGNTALHFANSYGYTTVANYLISKGADDTLMNNQGKTCYEKL